MKKITVILLALCILVSFSQALSEGEVSVTVNGRLLGFDQPPVIENGRTLVPMRAIFEALGCTVEYYEGEEKYVFAQKGFDNISLMIGDDTMYLNGETEIALDVPAKIVNDRTLVPLRAVSEAFDCSVLWDEDERAVIIESRQGAHNIERREIKQRIEGKIAFEINAVYPYIESEGNEFIDRINEEYESGIRASIAEALGFYNEILEYIEPDDEYETTLTYNSDFDVTFDRNGYLSILTVYSSYTGGAHPNSIMEGRTFDLRSNKELSMREVFNEEVFDLDNAVAERIYRATLEYSDEEHAKSVHDAALEEIDNAEFYLTDSGVHVFYVPYQIASYAEGYPAADIDYDSEYIKVDLSGYDMQELVFEIEGNRTTGYEWTVTQDSDKLDTDIYYVEPQTNLPGAGGVYKMHIKGVKPGNATVKLEYKRGWEENPIDTLEYKFYVENDLGVTLMDVK